MSGRDGGILSVKAQGAGDDSLYYMERIENEPPELYPDGVAAGRWMGAGAEALSLDGAVERVAFAKVLSGVDPGSGRGLVSGKAAAEGRTPGYDLTFSAPLFRYRDNGAYAE